MIWLLLSVITNAFIGVIFKFFGKYEINNRFAIALNYFVCVATASVVVGANAIPNGLSSKPWFWIALFLGVLFPIIFNLYALSVQKIGIVISTIFQKMSLIAPVLLAILYFGESLSIYKGLGIAAAMLAIYLIPKEEKSDDHHGEIKKFLWIPILVFIGSALIDCGLLITEKMEGADDDQIGFVASLFLFAGVGAIIIYAIDYFKTRTPVKTRDIVAGFALGIPNFFSIYFIMMGLASGMAGTRFFPLNNVGILVISTLFGVLWFSEKMNKYRYIGFAISILAILLLSYTG